MRILVIDGQGGSVGRALIAAILREIPQGEIVAVGTNAASTSAMLKGGAPVGATGENAVIYNAGRCDVIVGPIGIMVPNAMHGEVSPAMAHAVGASEARKVLIPSTQCNTTIVGTAQHSIAEYIAQAVAILYGIASV